MPRPGLPRILPAMFLDEVNVQVVAGRGGNGSASFLRTRSQPKGGPDGGDGGRGGNVTVVADHNTSTLSAYRSAHSYHAGDGGDGHGSKKYGKKGTDLTLRVPPGTVVKVDGKVIADLDHTGAEFVIAHGGRGGLGNTHFATSTHQAPRFAELGEEGDSIEAVFELKLIADIGLVGLPNAGKSTLLSVVSAAKPKIANYPFTTLVPQLGVVSYGGSEFTMADIPGLIEGAHTGKGLGTAFLKHLERTRGLLIMVDAAGEPADQTYDLLMHELEAHSAVLAARPQRVVLTKVALATPEQRDIQLKRLAKAAGVSEAEILQLSSEEHVGINELSAACLQLVQQAQEIPEEVVDEQAVIDVPLDDVLDWYIEPSTEGGWQIKGVVARRWAQRTNMQSQQAVERLKSILHRAGILKQLEQAGVDFEKDTIVIADKEIPWND